MYNSLLASIFLTFSLFFASVLAGAEVFAPGPVLTVRQEEGTGVNSPACLEYARTANLSTVGANSTYRATFLQMSSTGTTANARMFSDAMGKLPEMTANADLNSQCGNWTEIAVAEAEKNFTEWKVLEFSDVIQDAQVIKAGPELIGLVALINVIFFGVWCFMP